MLANLKPCCISFYDNLSLKKIQLKSTEMAMTYQTKCNWWLLFSYIGGVIGGLYAFSLFSLGKVDNLLPLVVLFAFIFSAPIFIFIFVLCNNFFVKMVKNIYLWTFIAPFAICLLWLMLELILFDITSDNSLVRIKMVFVCSIIGSAIFSLGAIITKNERGV